MKSHKTPKPSPIENRNINKRKTWILLCLLTGISAFLLLKNLGNQYLWQDEAQTACISRTILTDGVPRGTDGKNFFSQERGAEYGENYIWKWHTWLPFYIVAGFYEVFGISTFTSRLPFALFGIASVALTFVLAKHIWKNLTIAVMAAILVLFSVPFLLLCRQCRWYSMAIFFSLWSVYAYSLFLTDPTKKKYWISFVIGVSGLFHTHYLYCGTFFMSMFVHTLLFHRRRFLPAMGLIAATMTINSPWIIWLMNMGYGKAFGTKIFSSTKFNTCIIQYTRLILKHMIPWPMLIILAAGWGYLKFIKKNRIPSDKEKDSREVFFMLYIISTFIALVIFSPWPYFRYIGVFIPFISMLAAVAMYALRPIHKLLPPVLVLVMLAFHPLLSFGYEITHDYDGPNEGIIHILNKEAQPDDVVLVTYGDMPLKFYTKLKIRGGLTGEDLKDVIKPDWIIIRTHLASEYTMKVYQHINDMKINKKEYDPLLTNFPDIKYENREEPDEHLFKTVVQDRTVLILRKKKNYVETGKPDIFQLPFLK